MKLDFEHLLNYCFYKNTFLLLKSYFDYCFTLEKNLLFQCLVTVILIERFYLNLLLRLI